jgi:hypothetical protein
MISTYTADAHAKVEDDDVIIVDHVQVSFCFGSDLPFLIDFPSCELLRPLCTTPSSSLHLQKQVISIPPCNHPLLITTGRNCVRVLMFPLLLGR